MTATLDPTITTGPDSETPRLRMLDPKGLLLDGNVRTAVDLDADFVASIKDHGVLQPISAVLTAEGGVRVRYGQRRALGAIAAGRELVPVIITGSEGEASDAGEIERIVTQFHENEHRTGLGTADRAAAVEQLAAFGLSAAQIHRRMKGSRVDVDHALAVARSELAKKAARYDFLDLQQAATVAEFFLMWTRRVSRQAAGSGVVLVQCA